MNKVKAKKTKGRMGKWLSCLFVNVRVFAYIVFVLTVSQPVYAAVFDCPSGDVSCLIEKVNQANANGEADTINLEGGTYTLMSVDNTIDGPNGLPSITSPITINGTGAETTVIERDSIDEFRIFHVGIGGTLILEGLTVTGGDANYNKGGGIFNWWILTVINSTISGNSAMYGGGIFNELYSYVTITKSAIAGNSAYRGGGIYHFGDSGYGHLTITNGTITGNSAEDSGGGIYNERGLVIANSTIFSGNSAYRGGGICNKRYLAITNGTISGNSADYGGGIANSDYAHMTITNSTITGNSAEEDVGGIGNDGDLTITDSTITRNSAERYCGGIYNDGDLTIKSSRISFNSADRGGGIDNYGDLTITDSTIDGNSAADRGGGIDNYGDLTIAKSLMWKNVAGTEGGGIFNSGWSDSNVTITNSTIARNSAMDGGGIYNDEYLAITNSTITGNSADSGGGIVNNATVELQNTILAINTAEHIGHDYIGEDSMSLGNNLFGRRPGGGMALHHSDIIGDPCLGLFSNGRPGKGHFPLLPGSPAIDAGNDDVCPETDQLGNFRPVDGDGIAVCDIGAIEFIPQFENITKDMIDFTPEPGPYYVKPFTKDYPPSKCGCPDSSVAFFGFGATLHNKSECKLSNLTVKVVTLDNDNSLLLGTGGEAYPEDYAGAETGGEGALWTLPYRQGSNYSTGILDKDKKALFVFAICLEKMEPFRFYVDLLGTVR